MLIQIKLPCNCVVEAKRSHDAPIDTELKIDETAYTEHITSGSMVVEVRHCDLHRYANNLYNLVNEAYQDYSHPNFTDRSGFADRAKKVLDAIK